MTDYACDCIWRSILIIVYYDDDDEPICLVPMTLVNNSDMMNVYVD